MILEDLQEDDPFVLKLVQGFTGAVQPNPADLLFPQDRDKTLSIWDDVDWWTGESKGPPVTDQMSSTKKEREQAEETFQQSTPGSSASFQAAQAATMGTNATQRWFQMENGNIPLKKLTPIGNGLYLRRDAAAAFKAMRRAAKKDGITIVPNEAYRTRETQAQYWEESHHGTDYPVAAPGTSNHGWGMAVDMSAGPARDWMMQHAAKFGFHNDVANDAPHFDFKPTPDMEFKIPKTKSQRPRTKPLVEGAPGRHVGAQDLSSTIPLGTGTDFTSALVSLVHDDVQVDTPKGKRNINLQGWEKPTNTAGIVQYARHVAKQYGWNDREFQMINTIIAGGNWRGHDVVAESGWDPTADNPTSTATGIPQRLVSKHPWQPGEQRKWKDPRYQVRWLMAYIKNHWGTPEAALQNKIETGWY